MGCMTNSRQIDQLNAFATAQLQILEVEHLRQRLHPSERGMASSAMRDGQMVISFCDNDYLGLTQHPRVIAAAGASAIRHGAGVGGSRLTGGDSPLNHQLEALLSQKTGLDATRLFGSDYLANISLIPSLVGPGDIIILDEASHAGIQAGVRLSGAELRIYRHKDLDHAQQLLSQNRPEEAHVVLMTETVFSEDGSLAPLIGLNTLCEEHGAWLATDDSHGFGVVTQDNPAPLQMGALSNAAGVYGGYVSGPASLIDLFVSKADPFVQDSGLPPQILGAAIEALKVMDDEPQLRQRVMDHAREFCRIMELPTPQSAIVPVTIDVQADAVAISDQLLSEGYYIAPTSLSTATRGPSRLRVTFSASHEDEDVTGLAHTLQALLKRRQMRVASTVEADLHA